MPISDVDVVMGEVVEARLYEAKASVTFGYPKDSRFQIRVQHPEIVFVHFDGKTIGTARVVYDPTFDNTNRATEFTFLMQLQYQDGARIEIGEGDLCAKAQFKLVTSVGPAETKVAGQGAGLAVYEMLSRIDLVRSSKDKTVEGRVTFA